LELPGDLLEDVVPAVGDFLGKAQLPLAGRE
jgi:hypothetical protein